MKVYTYQELCEMFGEECKTGSTKYSQINRWRKKCNIEQIGNKYLIIEIYDSFYADTKKQRVIAAINKVGDNRLDYFNVEYENFHKGGIYQIYNAATKEIYIGQTKDFQRMFRQHWCNDNNQYTTTYNMLHNGAIFSVLEVCDDKTQRDDLLSDYREKYSMNEDYICINKHDRIDGWSTIKVRAEDKNDIIRLLQENGYNLAPFPITH